MNKLNSLTLLLAALLLCTGMSLTACGDDSSSSSGDGDGDTAAGDGDGDTTAGDGDGDGTTTFTCDETPCEDMTIMVVGMTIPLTTCCLSNDECGIDASMLGMGCVTLDTVAAFQGGADAGM